MVSSKQTDMADKKGRAHTKSSLASELEQGRRQFKNIESNRERDSTLILFQKNLISNSFTGDDFHKTKQNSMTGRIVGGCGGYEQIEAVKMKLSHS